MVTGHDDPQDCLFSSESNEECEGVRQIQVSDGGSHSQSMVIEIEGVPAEEHVNTGSDITINGRFFEPPDKSSRMYSNQPFHLDGRMDLKLSFGEKDLVTTVYIKMDAPDPLLPSKEVSPV